MEELVGSEEEGDQRVNVTGDTNGSCTPPEVAAIPLSKCPRSDGIFKELSIINGQINGLKRKDLIAKLKKYHLNYKGDIRVLKKRLKNHYYVTKLTKANLMEKQILQPYYVVIDFEATCQENNPVDYKYEIIEFPAILVHTESLKIVDVFHSFVKPVIHPKLTAFCVNLTGITQEEVDKAPTFKQVLRKFEAWLELHGLLTSEKFIVTDGPWDMGRFLYLNCKISKITYPSYATEWINIRRIFRNFYKYYQGGSLEEMIKFAGLKFEGRAHSGLDDSYNIARMFLHLLKDGAMIRTNERITKHTRSHNNLHFVQVGYKSHLNTHEDVVTLSQELSTFSIDSDEEENSTEQSDHTSHSPSLDSCCNTVSSGTNTTSTNNFTSSTPISTSPSTRDSNALQEGKKNSASNNSNSNSKDKISSTKNNTSDTINDISKTKNDRVDTKNNRNDTKNDISRTKNNESDTKNNKSCTKNDISNTKNDKSKTKNKSDTKNDISRTKNDKSDTQNNKSCTKNDISDTKNDISKTKNKSDTKNDISRTKNNISCRRNAISNTKKDTSSTINETSDTAFSEDREKPMRLASDAKILDQVENKIFCDPKTRERIMEMLQREQARDILSSKNDKSGVNNDKSYSKSDKSDLKNDKSKLNSLISIENQEVL